MTTARAKKALPSGPSRLVAGYRALPGVPDELLDSSGSVRPVWSQLIKHMSGWNAAETTERFARGDQYLRDAGVYYRQYGQGADERDWPLSHVPVLLAAEEWRKISAGLIQRAEVLEDVVADIYGQNRLVAEGVLPAGLIAQSPEWLRPLVGIRPPSGHFLHFLAFEIGRGPRGDWWVLGDRTQAPSGAGFALENRFATARIYSDLYPQANVHRLAGFFRAFREALFDLRADQSSQIGILTPGPLSDTYYEHAYIARYLGMMLLEGEDLTVENGALMVRTINGPRPISVLWRRLDAAWADPLALKENSRLGTPGLVQAIASGNISMVNALGAGILETRALLAFLPRICELLRGEPLALPNIATWWCGQAAERAHVRAHAGEMIVGPALSTAPPMESDDDARVSDGLAEIDARLQSEGALLIGQEIVKLSTTPVYVDGRLAPRPMSLRVFLARTRTGWRIMPGGFARIGSGQDAAAIAMRRGSSVADVWIVDEQSVPHDTLLTQPQPGARSALPAPLPSRAGDNLYWLGRYVERSEGMMRLLRAYNGRLAETHDPDAPLLKAIGAHLKTFGVDPTDGMPEGLRDTIASAIRSASKIRDRFSVDGWAALADLDKTARQMSQAVTPGDDAALAQSVLLRKITGFSGLVHENMHRNNGWRILTIGRSIERAATMARLLARFAVEGAPEGALDLVIEIGDSAMTHRRLYSVTTTRQSVLELLALDARNPRSILYHLKEIDDQAGRLPRKAPPGHMSELSRAVLRAHTDLAVTNVTEMDAKALRAIADALFRISDLLSTLYLN
jgi:uncharacterized circularly permuted ATP-grasp superfamily protein/uncharacterized alpha-E superfamily protein